METGIDPIGEALRYGEYDGSYSRRLMEVYKDTIVSAISLLNQKY